MVDPVYAEQLLFTILQRAPDVTAAIGQDAATLDPHVRVTYGDAGPWEAGWGGTNYRVRMSRTDSWTELPADVDAAAAVIIESLRMVDGARPKRRVTRSEALGSAQRLHAAIRSSLPQVAVAIAGAEGTGLPHLRVTSRNGGPMMVEWNGEVYRWRSEHGPWETLEADPELVVESVALGLGCSPGAADEQP